MSTRYRDTLLLIALLILGAGNLLAQSESTITTLSVSSDTIESGQILTAIAHVTAAGSPVNTGYVAFTLDGIEITQVLVINSVTSGSSIGTATLHRSFTKGVHQLSAAFVRNAEYEASQSQTISLTVDESDLPKLHIDQDLGQSGIVRYALLRKTAVVPAGTLSLQNTANGSVLSETQIPMTATMQPYSQIYSNTGGQHPVQFVMGDFDGDGLNDIAIINQGNNTVSILLADKSGQSFNLASSISVTGTPTGIATADFNNDGILDLAVIDSTTGMLYIFLGDPDQRGQFVALDAPILLNPGLTSIITTDVNNDGIADLIVTNSIANTVSVLLGSPSDPGHFSLNQTINVTGGPYAVAAGDLDGNGLADIAVTTYEDGTLWILNNDSANIGKYIVPQGVQKIGLGPTSIAIADLNNDGIPDIVVCNSLDGTVSVLLGNANDRGKYLTQRVISVGSGPDSVAVVMSGDKSGDLIVGNYNDGSIDVLDNGGDAAFLTSKVIYAGESISQVASLESEGLIIASDPDANVLRIISNKWILSGTFPVITASANGTFTLQASLDEPWSELLTPITSNIITMSDSVSMSQQISFNPPATIPYGTPVTLVASASSGLLVALRILSGSASLVGSTVTPASIGSFVVEASQSGNDSYGAAPFVDRSITVMPAPLSVIANPATMVVGQSLPLLSGSLVGVVNGDNIQATYVSQVSSTTPVGIYTQWPNAVTPVLVDPEKRLTNYSVTLSTAPLSVINPISHPSSPVLSPVNTPTVPQPVSGPAPYAPVTNPITNMPVTIPIATPPSNPTTGTGDQPLPFPPANYPRPPIYPVGELPVSTPDQPTNSGSGNGPPGGSIITPMPIQTSPISISTTPTQTTGILPTIEPISGVDIFKPLSLLDPLPLLGLFAANNHIRNITDKPVLLTLAGSVDVSGNVNLMVSIHGTRPDVLQDKLEFMDGEQPIREISVSNERVFTLVLKSPAHGSHHFMARYLSKAEANYVESNVIDILIPEQAVLNNDIEPQEEDIINPVSSEICKYAPLPPEFRMNQVIMLPFVGVAPKACSINKLGFRSYISE